MSINTWEPVAKYPIGTILRPIRFSALFLQEYAENTFKITDITNAGYTYIVIVVEKPSTSFRINSSFLHYNLEVVANSVQFIREL